MSMVHSAASTDLDGNDDKLRGSSKTNNGSSKMFSIGRELCFLLLIALTTYASFNSNGNTGGGPPPSPFFPKGSLVGDFFRGELSEALLRASESDVAFFMYYAPWDADSQRARTQFEAVAHQHYRQVYFAGINCWQPRGECKRTLSKIHQFPKLVAYITHETGVEYRGPRDAAYMSAFLDRVMRPLHRLRTAADLVRLRSAYNAVVVAYMNFLGLRGGPPYRAMYETALRFLEQDVRQEVAFAVVTSFQTTLEMGGDRTPSIRLYLWNETLDYTGHLAADHLAEWVSARLHQVSLWLSPPGVKSLTLAPYVTHGPALLMFTPRHNFVMYNLLREVGLEYYNCNNNSYVTELAHNVSIYVSERISQVRRAMLSCQSHIQDSVPTVRIVNNVWTNISCDKRRDLCAPYTSTPQTQSQCGRRRSLLTPPPMPQTAALSSEALSQWARRDSCRHTVTPPPRLPATPLPLPVRGLACRQNHSISLLAMDSALFSHFAQGLGVDVDAASEHTSVVMLNSQMETTHVLEEPVSRESLGMFLVNFTEGKLERYQRVQVQPAAQSPPPPHSTHSDGSSLVSVQELTTNTFLPVAFNDSMNVIVFFYTPYCAFCHAVGHVYLTVARLLRDVPTLSFTRLDGENNDLAWQFTTPHYPSILFFPARRKAESRVLTPNVAITVDSLTQFVLANLPLELRLLAMLQVCQHYPPGQWAARRWECLVDVRREVLNAVGTRLARYRALALRLRLAPSRERREALGKELKRLQALRQLQVSLSAADTARPAAQLARLVLHDEL